MKILHRFKFNIYKRLNMKKIITLIMTTAMLSSIAYAQDKNTPRDTLAKITAKGEIIMAVRENSVPFSYYDEKGNVIGYTIEVCERVVKKLRKNLNMASLRVVYLPVQAKERMDVVRDGIADMECGVTTNTRDRQKSVAFSVGVFAVETKFVTDKNLTFKDVSELNGKQISISKQSIGETYVNEEKKKRNLTYQVNPYADTKEAILAVLDGSNQGHPNDDILLYSQLAFNQAMKDKLHVTGNPFAPNTYGIVLPRGDTKFKKEVDTILTDLLKSEEIVKIYNRWFLNPIPPKNVNINFPMNDTTKTIFATPTDAAFID